MANQKLSLTRDQFASFLQDFEQIKQFERLFSTTNANVISIDEVNISAGNAGASANNALAQIIELSETLNKEPTPANVSQLAVVQSDLQALALSPAPRSGVAPPSEGGTGTSTQFTTGSVVFAGASGVYSQDNANFFWNDTSNFLGLGTASPSSRLNMVGHNEFSLGLTAQTSSTQTAILNHPVALLYNSSTAAGNGAGLRYQLADTGGTARTAGGIGVVATAKAASSVTADMYFYTGAAEQMRITSGGDVLIGSTSGTGAKLNVTGLIRSRTGAATTDVNHDGTNGSLASSSNLFLYANGANPLVLHTNSIERMRIDSSGNVGVGTTANASAILDVQSTTKGFRLPNMTTTQKNAISSPAAGLMVFDTTLSKACVYSGSAWETITSL
jgi:hypothetical protein